MGSIQIGSRALMTNSQVNPRAPGQRQAQSLNPSASHDDDVIGAGAQADAGGHPKRFINAKRI
jgi:hypothetical protein